MMILNNTYNNIYNKDIAFQPVFLEKETEESLTFYGKWFNIVSTPFVIDYDTITINKKDLNNWKELNS